MIGVCVCVWKEVEREKERDRGGSRVSGLQGDRWRRLGVVFVFLVLIGFNYQQNLHTHTHTHTHTHKHVHQNTCAHFLHVFKAPKQQTACTKNPTTLRELSFIALSDNRPLKFLRSDTGGWGREGKARE